MTLWLNYFTPTFLRDVLAMDATPVYVAPMAPHIVGWQARAATYDRVWRPCEGSHTNGLEAWTSLDGGSFRAILTQKGYFCVNGLAQTRLRSLKETISRLNDHMHIWRRSWPKDGSREIWSRLHSSEPGSCSWRGHLDPLPWRGHGPLCGAVRRCRGIIFPCCTTYHSTARFG
jgi:hypothetical protein